MFKDSPSLCNRLFFFLPTKINMFVLVMSMFTFFPSNTRQIDLKSDMNRFLKM